MTSAEMFAKIDALERELRARRMTLTEALARSIQLELARQVAREQARAERAEREEQATAE